jgi:hypothetical protein
MLLLLLHKIRLWFKSRILLKNLWRSLRPRIFFRLLLMASLCVLWFIMLFEFLISINEIKILSICLILLSFDWTISHFIFDPFDWALSELLKAIHLSRITQRSAIVRWISYLLDFFCEIKQDGEVDFLNIFGDGIISSQTVFCLDRSDITMIFLLYSQW